MAAELPMVNGPHAETQLFLTEAIQGRAQMLSIQLEKIIIITLVVVLEPKAESRKIIITGTKITRITPARPIPGVIHKITGQGPGITMITLTTGLQIAVRVHLILPPEAVVRMEEEHELIPVLAAVAVEAETK